jgi:hypothetical protein
MSNGALAEQTDDLDRPEESASADLTLVAHGITVTACVEESGTGVVVVVPAGDGDASRASVIGPGDAVELYWVGGEEERTLKGLVAGIGTGDYPRWRITVSGPAERSQRRKAVRARIQLPVLIPWAGGQLEGTTVDISEAGMRAKLNGWGTPLDPGDSCQVSLAIDDVLVHVFGEIVWNNVRGAEWLLAVKFVDVPERAADVLRRRVFKALRDERALGRD